MWFGKGNTNKGLDGELVPYMDAVEFAQMRAVVETLAPRRVLEWGSGGSTKALLDACPFIERFVSIEHDPNWVEKVREKVIDPRLELHLKEADDTPPDLMADRKAFQEWAARAERDPALMATYVGFPATLGIAFDFVLVDGRARRLCVAAGWELLRSGGVLLLHDAQREDYHDAVEALGERAIFLEPWGGGQICIIRKP